MLGQSTELSFVSANSTVTFRLSICAATKAQLKIDGRFHVVYAHAFGLDVPIQAEAREQVL